MTKRKDPQPSDNARVDASNEHDSTRSLNDPTEAVATSRKQSDFPERIGRYRVTKLLGDGAFGRVFLASDEQLKREVAIKVPHADLVAAPEQAEAYFEEARTVANLDHPYIVPVYDVGSCEGFPFYVVSKYIPGGDLKRWLKEASPSVVESAHLIATLAEALHHAHTRGFVHRDVKPGNILIDKDGKPYLADFGLALNEHDFGKGAQYAGTPGYMSPEQARGEGHRVDGRSDIFSLGVVLYELTAGRRPFKAKTTSELLSRISSTEAKPPRQINDAMPRELERICLKALANRARDRFTTALDLADDLRHFLSESSDSVTSISAAVTVDQGSAESRHESSGSTEAEQETAVKDSDSGSGSSRGPLRIVPKGLRSFDAHDADFFLELLPGARDRYGIPDSIRFWKTRIEEFDPDETFSVGLIYGPSGCGKSSLVKAGLLPLLCEDIVAVYVESTPDETESRLLYGLRKQCPGVDEDLCLKETLTSLRRGTGIPTGTKVLIVLDQFEQWLHAKKEDQNTELVQALRQCDGGRVQSIVMVRDDFWLAATRFLGELEVDLLQGHNTALADLFDLKHARKVLAALGRAFGRLPEDVSQVLSEQQSFLTKCIQGLASEGKVVCVRLALFAEMMKGKDWNVQTLASVGGTEGVGVTFLEETFSSASANPKHRLHQKAARGVLRALLPDSGSDIKGEMKSDEELLEASGYVNRRKDFDELIQILDSEIRLITPTDPEGFESDDEDSPSASLHSASTTRYFQLTHDYLVPSLREWLTRKQKETRRGRAELLLVDRASTWQRKPERRNLPSTREWLQIRSLTRKSNWTETQRRMINKGARVHGVFWGGMLSLLIVLGIVGQMTWSRIQTETNREKTVNTVRSLETATGTEVKYVLDILDTLPREMVVNELNVRFADAEGQAKLSLAYGLAHYKQYKVDAIFAGLLDPETANSEASNIVVALEGVKSEAIPKLRSAAETAAEQLDWSTKTRLAVTAMYLGHDEIAAEMLRGEPIDVPLEPNPLPDLLGDYQRQLEEIAQLPTDERDSPENRLIRASALSYLDRPMEALVDLEWLAQQDSVSAQTWQLLALNLARTERPAEAAQAADELAGSTSSVSYAAIGSILSQAWGGDITAAINALESLIDQKRESGLAHYNGACIAAQLVRVCDETHPQDADHLRQRAVELLRRAYNDLNYRGSARPDTDPDFIPLHDDVGFQALVAELFPPRREFDPVQRTRFISSFVDWPGDLTQLANLIRDVDDPHFRSGIALSVGGIERPGGAAKEAWQKTLADWYENVPDGSTHSASEWALRQWELDVPELATEPEPRQGRNWWRTSDLTLIKIPSGSVAGESGLVVVDHDFWLSDREVSVGLFQQFIDDAEYPGLKPDVWDGAREFEGYDSTELPVQQVSWFDAVMFCNWLSWKLDLEAAYKIVETGSSNPDEKYSVELLPTGGFRMPTDAEWEYACRAKTTTDFAFGDLRSDLSDYGWFSGNSESRTHMVGSKRCNAWGLFDMHGSVWEWCWDWYSSQASNRVDRGGCWGNVAQICQSSYRGRFVPSRRDFGLGFRVALGPSGQLAGGQE